MRRSDFIFKFRVRNWPAYNRALVRRDSITFWVDEGAVQAWDDRHLRTLLIHGARAGTRVARNSHSTEALWLKSLIEGRGYNRATVALANKMARKAWVVLNRGERIAAPA